MTIRIEYYHPETHDLISHHYFNIINHRISITAVATYFGISPTNVTHIESGQILTYEQFTGLSHDNCFYNNMVLRITGPPHSYLKYFLKNAYHEMKMKLAPGHVQIHPKQK